MLCLININFHIKVIYKNFRIIINYIYLGEHWTSIGNKIFINIHNKNAILISKFSRKKVQIQKKFAPKYKLINC